MSLGSCKGCVDSVIGDARGKILDYGWVLNVDDALEHWARVFDGPKIKGEWSATEYVTACGRVFARVERA